MQGLEALVLVDRFRGRKRPLPNRLAAGQVDAENVPFEFRLRPLVGPR